MVLDDWHRIEKIVSWAGLTTNAFAINIGLPRGENLYQIKRGNNGISKEVAELISAKYPEISRAWVLTGEGEMLIGESGERVAIPCHDIDILALAAMDKMPQASHVISLPRLRGAAMAGLLMNKSMEPDIPNGSTVVVSETTASEIVPGYPYVVVTGNFSALRTVKRKPGSDKLCLVAANPEFDDIETDLCEVKKIFRVKGHIYYNQ